MKHGLSKFFQKNVAAKGTVFSTLAFLCGLFNSQLFALAQFAWPCIWSALQVLFAAMATIIGVPLFFLFMCIVSASSQIFFALLLATSPFLIVALLKLCRPKAINDLFHVSDKR